MLLYMGSVSFDVVPVISHRPATGSVYRSPELYLKLKPDMDSDNSSADAVSFFFFFLAFSCDGMIGSEINLMIFVGFVKIYCIFWVNYGVGSF